MHEEIKDADKYNGGKVEDENPDLKKQKPLLFIFPESQKAVPMFDTDELDEENLCILCKSDDNSKKVFIWRGDKVQASEEVIKDSNSLIK